MPDSPLTKAMRRDIASLASAKGRRKLGAFMAEGTKCVLDTVGHFDLRTIVATEAWLAEHAAQLPAGIADRVIPATRGMIGEMSSMTLASDVIAIYNLPPAPEFDSAVAADTLVLALDRVQDPGNLGTIMRTADWMGVTTIFASEDTVDCFNPKTVQATMGAISRVRVVYGDLVQMLGSLPGDTPVYGTFLDGDNIYTSPLTAAGVIVMGNEGRGISPEVAGCVSRRLLIPPYPAGADTSESLNVGSATAIVLSQFRARLYGKS